MLIRLSTSIAALCMLSGAAFAQSTAKPTDPQIAHIAYTAGELDIEAAKQALSKSTNKDVRAFADGMVSDHTKAICVDEPPRVRFTGRRYPGARHHRRSKRRPRRSNVP